MSTDTSNLTLDPYTLIHMRRVLVDSFSRINPMEARAAQYGVQLSVNLISEILHKNGYAEYTEENNEKGE